MSLGHRVYLKAKAGGDNSMPEKRGSLEGAEGAVPQDPRDKAKAGLPCVVLSDVVSLAEQGGFSDNEPGSSGSPDSERR